MSRSASHRLAPRFSVATFPIKANDNTSEWIRTLGRFNLPTPAICHRSERIGRDLREADSRQALEARILTTRCAGSSQPQAKADELV